MADFEQRLDPRYSMDAKGGPMFSTEVTETTGGQAFTNRNWQYPLQRFDITQGVKKPNDFAVIRAFFYNVGGRADAFRFKWWPDYKANGDPLALISGVVFQLQRAYTVGVRTTLRTINKPVANVPLVVTRTRGVVKSVVSTTIDYTTGKVTISDHLGGDTYTWAGEFDVRVAFLNDSLEEEVVDRGHAGLLTRWPSIQLKERRL